MKRSVPIFQVSITCEYGTLVGLECTGQKVGSRASNGRDYHCAVRTCFVGTKSLGHRSGLLRRQRAVSSEEIIIDIWHNDTSSIIASPKVTVRLPPRFCATTWTLCTTREQLSFFLLSTPFSRATTSPPSPIQAKSHPRSLSPSTNPSSTPVSPPSTAKTSPPPHKSATSSSFSGQWSWQAGTSE